MKTLVLILAAIGLALTAACGDDGTSAPPGSSPDDGKAFDVRGVISRLATPVPGVSTGAFVVEGEVEDDTRYAAAIVRLAEETRVSRRQAGQVVAATIADLADGRRVEIIFTGNVAQSARPVGVAGEIFILD